MRLWYLQQNSIGVDFQGSESLIVQYLCQKLERLIMFHSTSKKGIAAVLLFTGASVAFAQSFDFKGIVLGSKVDASALAQEHGLSCVSRDPRATICTGKTTFLGMDAHQLVVIDAQAVVSNIKVTYATTTVWPKNIAAELSKKFGPPKYQQSAMIFTWINQRKEMAHLEHRQLEMKIPEVRKEEPPPSINKKDL